MYSTENLYQQENILSFTGDLADLNSVSFDLSLPASQRLFHYLEQIKNPYQFKVGEVAVSLDYAQSGDTLYTTLLSYFLNL